MPCADGVVTLHTTFLTRQNGAECMSFFLEGRNITSRLITSLTNANQVLWKMLTLSYGIFRQTFFSDMKKNWPSRGGNWERNSLKTFTFITQMSRNIHVSIMGRLSYFKA